MPARCCWAHSLAAFVALLIGRPTLRLSGVYLAMATLAFGEVVRITILNSETLTGGALGLNGIPHLTSALDVALAVDRNTLRFAALRALANRPYDERHLPRRDRYRAYGLKRTRV